MKIFRILIIYFILISPLSFGIVSCSNNKKTNKNFDKKLDKLVIPKISAVAALGQLLPAGDIRKLAAPVGQFGSSPRITELLVNEGDFVNKGDILTIFENRGKLIADLRKNLIKTIDQISLKEDQIKRQIGFRK